jgi:hypothetical protein
VTDLSELLQEHVAAATPATFDAVLRRVRRRRRRQVTGAAVAVVLVVAGAALAAGHQASPATTAPLATTVPATMTVKGIPLELDKRLPFGSVLVASRQARALLVPAGTRPVRPDGCHPWSMPFVLAQDDDRVVIGVYDYVLASGDRSCFAYGLGTAQLPLELGQPLGDRRVVDAQSGRAVPVVDQSRYLSPSAPPTGYRVVTVGGVQRNGWAWPRYTQTWQGPHGALLVLLEGPVGAMQVHVQHEGSVTVRGRAGELVRVAGAGNRCLRWEEAADDAVELCSQGYSQDVLTVDQLARVAEGLHRP